MILFVFLCNEENNPILRNKTSAEKNIIHFISIQCFTEIKNTLSCLVIL